MPMFPWDNLTECKDCGEKIPDGWEYRMGPKMWHVRRWTCGHVVQLQCRTCYADKSEDKDNKCPQCGCNCEYT